MEEFTSYRDVYWEKPSDERHKRHFDVSYSRRITQKLKQLNRINFIIHTCVFPTATCEIVVHEEAFRAFSRLQMSLIVAVEAQRSVVRSSEGRMAKFKAIYHFCATV